jgi:hypothetical protein
MKASIRPIVTPSATKTSKEDIGERKPRRRHTRIHLESLKPALSNHLTGILTHCPKCHGLVLTEGGATVGETVVRCLNCGWQPHFHAPIIQETAESRTIRSLTARFLTEHDWHRVPVEF